MKKEELFTMLSEAWGWSEDEYSTALTIRSLLHGQKTYSRSWDYDWSN